MVRWQRSTIILRVSETVLPTIQDFDAHDVEVRCRIDPQYFHTAVSRSDHVDEKESTALVLKAKEPERLESFSAI